MKSTSQALYLSSPLTEHTRPDDRSESVVIFREHLGMESETFIYAQAASMTSFLPRFLGSRVAGSLPMQSQRVHAIVGTRRLSRIRAALFKFASLSTSTDRYLRSSRPALIHAHFGPDGALIEPFARRLGIPLLVTFHGYDATVNAGHQHDQSLTFRMYRHRIPRLQRYPARLIAVSDFIRDCLVRQGFAPEKIVRHYTGIDTKEFSPDPRVSREKVVLFVARLVEKKGCQFLVEAMQEVQRQSPDVDLVIIGEGPLRGVLESTAAHNRVSARFLGHQTPAAVRDWMRRATVFCVPSVTAKSGDAEGFGMVFAEAAAVGTPVVSFASGGLPESVAHGVTGLLSSERDVRALAANINHLLADHELWSRMSSAGVERVRRIFDVRKQTAALEDIYRDVASNSAASLRPNRHAL